MKLYKKPACNMKTAIKYSVRRAVKLCAIIQKETKVVQNFLTHLPDKVKEAVAANSLTSKKVGEIHVKTTGQM